MNLTVEALRKSNQLFLGVVCWSLKPCVNHQWLATFLSHSILFAYLKISRVCQTKTQPVMFSRDVTVPEKYQFPRHPAGCTVHWRQPWLADSGRPCAAGHGERWSATAPCHHLRSGGRGEGVPLHGPGQAHRQSFDQGGMWYSFIVLYIHRNHKAY